MRITSSLHFAVRRPAAATFLSLLALMTGCASTVTPTVEVAETPIVEPQPELRLVARYGRYTLVELAPTAAQRDLLLQVVDISIPNTLQATVGQAVRHVLLRSGYQLCDESDSTALHHLPLPAAHYRLGPMMLRDALVTLAGPAWNLRVDNEARRVCFSPVSPSTEEPSLPKTFPVALADTRIESLAIAGELP